MTLHRVLEKKERIWYHSNGRFLGSKIVQDEPGERYVSGGDQRPWMSGTLLLKDVLYTEELWTMLLIMLLIYFRVSVKVKEYL